MTHPAVVFKIYACWSSYIFLKKVSYAVLIKNKLRPKFSGSGKVIWQSPAPGTKKAPGSLCIMGLG